MPLCTATESSHLLVLAKAASPTSSPGHVGALQGHQLPADDGRVARVTRIVTPAAVGLILGVKDVVHRPLGGLTKVFIAVKP